MYAPQIILQRVDLQDKNSGISITIYERRVHALMNAVRYVVFVKIKQVDKDWPTVNSPGFV